MDVAEAYELARALAVAVDWPLTRLSPDPSDAFQQAYDELLSARAAEVDGGPAAPLAKDAEDAIHIARAYKRIRADADVRRTAVRELREHMERLEVAAGGVAAAHAAFVAELRDNDAAFTRMANVGRPYAAAVDEVAKSRTSEIARDVAVMEAGLREADEQLAAMREMLVAGAREVVVAGAADGKLCPICFEGEVEVACVPCGHTLCAACHAKAPSGTTCHTCRARVRERIRIFFSL